MELESDDTQIQVIQKKMDALLSEFNAMREQLSETERRLETKIGNLRKDMEANNDTKCGTTTLPLTQASTDLEYAFPFESFDGDSRKKLSQIDTDNQEKQIDTVPLIERETGRDLGGRTRGSLFVTRHSLSSEKKKSIQTSTSLHMYSAATISDPNNNSGFVWAITLLSLIVTISQFFVLYTAIADTSIPTCLSHEDCRTGEFCNFNTKDSIEKMPRCDDCVSVNKSTTCSSILGNYKDFSHPDYVQVDEMDIVWELKYNYTDTERDCFSQLHCEKTDLLPDKCDFLEMNLTRWNITQQLSLMFMALLFAVIISKDVQDALVEETYLNHGLKNNAIKPSCRLAAEILRMALRARQIVLPWYAAAAATGIIITNPINAENIILNLLTIDIILVADDMLATLFLPLFNQSSTEKLEESVARGNVEVSMVWSRIHGMIVAFALVLIIYFFQPLLNILRVDNDEGQCTTIFHAFNLCFTWIAPNGIILFHTVGYIALDSTRTTKCRAVTRGLGEMILDLVSYTFFSILSTSIFFVFTVKNVLSVARYIWNITYLFLFAVYNIARLYTSWQPIQRLHSNLFDT